MTKHRKGTTKPRKSIRRIKNRRYKTRRQSGGGYTSFITADENDVNGMKGIDVKVSTERHSDGNPMSWLIGGDGWMDATFGQLKSGAKGGRYQDFIANLEADPKFILTPTAFFTNIGKDADSSKGIRLTHDQFCRLLINGHLDYPKLKKRFRERKFTCSSAAPSSGPSAAPMSAYHPPSSAVQSYWQRTQPEPFTPLSDNSAGTAMPPQLQEWRSAAQAQAQAQQQPVSTKYFKELQEIKAMNLENVTDQMIVNALNQAYGNVNSATNKLMDAQSSAVSPSATIQERATIQDFLNAQNGTLPDIIARSMQENQAQFPGGKCPTYDQALKEINDGKKISHWIWYIIPSSPGRSVMSKFFGIGNHSNVTPEQYLSHQTLGARYVEILNAIGDKLSVFLPTRMKQQDVNQFLIHLMGSEIDFNKLRDSLSIFSNALTTQGKVYGNIALLASLGVKLYAPPPGPSAALTSAAMPIQQIAPQYAPVSAAVAFGAEQVFPVRNLSFKPKIADLMFPDEFVKKYANAYKLQFDQQESYRQDTRRTLDICPDVANWTVMSTIGDGNCLTHAFLQCMSSMYRKIHVKNEELPDEKIAVAQAFRLEFARINDQKFLLDKNPNIMREFTDGNGRTDLGEGTFASYARLFGVILVVFDVRNKQVMVANLTQETAIPNMPVIFIHGDGGHYSSVLPPNHSGSGSNPFVRTYEQAKKFRCLNEPLTFPNGAALNE
jgi:uncharacterized protein (DUF1810 family)